MKKCPAVKLMGLQLFFIGGKISLLFVPKCTIEKHYFQSTVSLSGKNLSKVSWVISSLLLTDSRLPQ